MQNTNYDARIRAAHERDEADRCKLNALHDIVAHTLDELVPLAGNLEHPDARWHPADLMQALQEQQTSIAWERDRMSRTQLVLEDE